MKKLVSSCVLVAVLSGCAATGTKSVDLWGLKWENFAGMDIHAGFNNIDRVDDRRGVDNRGQIRGVRSSTTTKAQGY